MFDHPFLDDQKETFSRQNCDFNWSIFFCKSWTTFVDFFLVYKMEYARRNGRSDNSRNLGGTLHITGLAHQNVSPVCGVLRSSSDRGWSGEGSYVYSKLVDKYVQVK